MYVKHGESNTIDGESFTGLNFRGFDPMWKYFRSSLARSAYVISIIIKEALM